MTYLYAKVFSDKARLWKEGFEIINDFLERMDSNILLDFSFNRYFGPSQEAYFELRCNFSDDNEGKQQANEILEDYKNKGWTSRYEDWVPFIRFTSVIIGCEMGTALSLGFKEWMDSNQNIFRDAYSSSERRIWFFSKFLPILLESYGFKVPFISHDMDDTYRRNLQDLADYCGTHCKYIMPTNLDVNFLERVLHHFSNCILLSLNEESAVYRSLLFTGWLGMIIHLKL